ncbi:hypothetical protein GCM10010286_40060 [Streptomyces toxytricini]|nr:hypothetical protein GCM10010286_40060 [Streptomyces toxytricini]
MDRADICTATAAVLSRHSGYDASITRAILQACTVACKALGSVRVGGGRTRCERKMTPLGAVAPGSTGRPPVPGSVRAEHLLHLGDLRLLGGGDVVGEVLGGNQGRTNTAQTKTPHAVGLSRGGSRGLM